MGCYTGVTENKFTQKISTPPGGDIRGSDLGISEEKVNDLGISDMKMKNLEALEKTYICSIFYQFEIPIGKSRILNDNLVISDK